MPIESNSQLPEAVRNSLGDDEQTKWRHIFNSAWEGTCNKDDGCAAHVAWSQMKKNARWFGGWASVEVLDKQNDVVTEQALKEAMDDFMALGGTLIDIHTNRKIGAWIDYAIKTKKDKPALWVEGVIYKRYRIHDIAWQRIVNKTYKGLSIGADPIGRGRQCNKDRCWNVIDKMQLFEISTVDDPANPEATIEVVNTMAKDDGNSNCLTINFINKSLPNPILTEAEDRVHTCPMCRSYYGQLLAKGMSEGDALGEIEQVLGELKELKAKGGQSTMVDTQPSGSATPASKPEDVKKDAGANPMEVLQQIVAKMADIEKRLLMLEQSKKPDQQTDQTITPADKAAGISIPELVKALTPVIDNAVKSNLKTMVADKPADTPRPELRKGDAALGDQIQELLKDKRKLAGMSISEIDALTAKAGGQ